MLRGPAASAAGRVRRADLTHEQRSKRCEHRTLEPDQPPQPRRRSNLNRRLALDAHPEHHQAALDRQRLRDFPRTGSVARTAEASTRLVSSPAKSPQIRMSFC